MITIQQEYKIVVTIGAGRKRYMELLFNQILREYDYIDEIRFCVNTNEHEDLLWLEETAKQYDKVTLDKRLGGGEYNALNLCRFWEGFQDPGSIYIRLDDDVVWIDEGFIQKMVEFRIKNLAYLFVFPNIINNSICDHIHERIGALDISEYIGYDCVDDNGILNGEVAIKKHRNFIEKVKENSLDDYRFTQWRLLEYERVSINSLCWFGRDLMGITVDSNEEQAISSDIPRQLNRPNIIYGEPLIVHFAFHTQRDYLDPTGILKDYRDLLSLPKPPKVDTVK